LTTGLVIGLSVGLILSPLFAAEQHLTIAAWLDVVHRVCTSVGGVGTFIALIFVVRQFNMLRAQSDLCRKTRWLRWTASSIRGSIRLTNSSLSMTGSTRCWTIVSGRYARSFQAFAGDLLARTDTPAKGPRAVNA
jgi:hypothetical protein